MDGDPLSAPAARALIRQILESGTTTSSRHFRERCNERNLTMLDAENALKHGWVGEAEFENGTWRYPVQTNLLRVIVALISETELHIVTIMRLK